MADQDTEVALAQEQPAAAGDADTAAAVTADGEDEDGDTIDDLEFLIDDIEDQIAPLGL